MIYNIDLVRTLSQAIKQQVMLNKDWDLAYYLGAYEAEMATNNASRIVDFEILKDMNNTISPNSVVNIFQSIVPFISSVSRQIRQNYRADPQYLLAGMKTASVLESLQQYYVKFGDNMNGETGSVGSTAGGFRNQTVLCSDALPENKIYVVYKAPSDDLARSTIVDLIYKPLYIIEEITNSVKRTFVKSRTALEFVRSESMGVVEIRNYDQFLG